MIDVTAVRERFPACSAHLAERSKRILAAMEARAAGGRDRGQYDWTGPG